MNLGYFGVFWRIFFGYTGIPLQGRPWLPHYFFTINVFLLPVNLDRCEVTRVETAGVLFVNLFPSNSFGHRFFTSESQFSSVSAVEWTSLSVGIRHLPTLVHVMRNTSRCQCTFMNEIIHLVLGLPRFLVSPGRPEHNAGFPLVVSSVHLATWPASLLYLSLLIVSMMFRSLKFIMASLSLQVALKFPNRYSGIDPKFFKSCIKLLDFPKKLLKNCSWIQLSFCHSSQDRYRWSTYNKT